MVDAGVKGKVCCGSSPGLETTKWDLKTDFDAHKLLGWKGVITGMGEKELSKVYLVGRLIDLTLETDNGKKYIGKAYMTSFKGDIEKSIFSAEFTGVGMLDIK